ncbi:alcohol dehydrogenase catalytic domain-containing protein [Oscillospiraceae bacterium MB08-C2-2]|nr:alcohol dehydrogenase catalytic domain-containing protein [Oscillospiraceae bacterium MB08-C2-2]
MKQIVITAPLQYEIQETNIPQPGKGEVLVQMKAASVCGSDIHLFLGENPNAVYPRIPGHENAGIIAQTGEGVSRVAAGDHVVVDLVVACGHCPQCRNGRRNICREVKARGAAADGGWREYFIVPEQDVYRISKEIPFRDACLVEPFAIGGHCTKRAQIQPGEMVLVFGSGSIGAVVLQTCKQMGCRVVCADVNTSSLERAKTYGADYIVNSREENLAEAIQKITGGTGVDVIFDCACFPGSLSLLLQPGIPTNGARIVPLGFSTEPEKISQAMINVRELSIIGTRMSSGQFGPTIEKMEKGMYTLEGMVSHYIPLSEVGQVFDNMKNPPADMKKMVILFEE